MILITRRTTTCLVFSVLMAAARSATGFRIPSPLLVKKSVASLVTTQTPPSLLNDGSPMMTVDGEPRWVSVSMPMDSFWMAEDGGGILDTVRNVALGITAIIFLLAGITFLYASVIIPAAANELEKECKELDPQLWEEYQRKLGEGETMATRPDLMQELGAKLQPMLEAKIAAGMAKDGGGSGGMSVPSPLQTTMDPMASSSSPKKSDVIDVPIIETSSPDQWDGNDGASAEKQKE